MKLSAAIEQAIVSGTYSMNNEFMCHIMQRMGRNDLKLQVEDMVQSLIPGDYRGRPLACALHDLKLININQVGLETYFPYLKQFYCWWIFDLKRKGL